MFSSLQQNGFGNIKLPAVICDGMWKFFRFHHYFPCQQFKWNEKRIVRFKAQWMLICFASDRTTITKIESSAKFNGIWVSFSSVELNELNHINRRVNIIFAFWNEKCPIHCRLHCKLHDTIWTKRNSHAN